MKHANLPPTHSPLHILVIAGEPSGDNLGAGLIKNLKVLSEQSDIKFWFSGIGAEQMQKEGVTSPFDIAPLSVIGFVEALMAAPKIKTLIKHTIDYIISQKPDVIVLIDSWGYTIRVAKAIRKIAPHIKLIKYVAPQVWAMRPKRAKILAESVDLLLALHSIDRPFFEEHGLKTVVVGNPAVHIDLSKADVKAFQKTHDLKPSDEFVLFLPGSRPSEVKKLLPVFSDTINLINSSHPKVRFGMVMAPSVAVLIKENLSSFSPQMVIVEDEAEKYSSMMACHTAVACSGTVTTEIALCKSAFCVAYIVEGLTYWIFKNFSTIDFVTMINIIGKKEIIPEFIQDKCTAQNLSAYVIKQLDSITLRKNQIMEQNQVIEVMGKYSPSPNILASRAIIEFCTKLTSNIP